MKVGFLIQIFQVVLDIAIDGFFVSYYAVIYLRILIQVQDIQIYRFQSAGRIKPINTQYFQLNQEFLKSKLQQIYLLTVSIKFFYFVQNINQLLEKFNSRQVTLLKYCSYSLEFFQLFTMVFLHSEILQLIRSKLSQMV
ncbi:transmembrane protein, putative (macronuclear) [Tetrahymena thermophila SB210]|uniref:Transmembrane protein, putative n=1 Tax=Tetrahymena thermophila (strain SB210) TaxID=312017 RepID=W7WX27_TETTS|nr:transmembrane protein, putative [Tetrahymena thermophila SB210]EWS71350.1 transmembrane protein, putative [Tetrahymena thermophila SB210]|eukprot:XP_012656124.1 transmembrane protein, putative [Tetrahymena thermophila SB210]